MDTLLASLNRLPVLPAAVMEVISGFDNPQLDSHDLATKISHDQSLSARILRMANSPFYGLPRQVASIQEAVMVLGFSSVRCLALAVGIAGAFPDTATVFPWSDYWKRSMMAAVYARSLAKCLKLDQEASFIAGLFHDIGLAVLAYGAPELLAKAQVVAGEGDLLAAERSVMGFDHAQLGGEVVRRWNFPSTIEQAIRQHRSAAAGEGEPLMLVTHAASLLSLAAVAGASDTEECLPQLLQAALGLDPERLRQCLPQQDDIEAACAALVST